MDHKPYIMKNEEIQTLVAGIMAHGVDDTYSKMRAKAIFAMDNKENIDDMFLDMSDTLLRLAREEVDSKDKNEDGDSNLLSNVYYTVSYMLKRIAHEVYRNYIKKGDTRDNSRFIRLVSYNKDAPLMV